MGLTREKVLLISVLYASMFTIVARRGSKIWSTDWYQYPSGSSSKVSAGVGRQSSSELDDLKLSEMWEMELPRFWLVGRRRKDWRN